MRGSMKANVADLASAGADIAALLEELRAELHIQASKRIADSEEVEELPPVVPVSATTVASVAQRYGLPTVYRDFLTALGQTGITIVPGPFQALTLYAAPELERAQVNFRGTRPGDESFVAPHGWRRSWVVIANDNGDPYFLDVSKPTPTGDYPVWTAMHGTGTWEPSLAASSLAQFLRILRVWVYYVVPHYDPQNPDEPLDDAHLRRMTSELNQIDTTTEHWVI
jgi:hypothetical protein